MMQEAGLFEQPAGLGRIVRAELLALADG